MGTDVGGTSGGMGDNRARRVMQPAALRTPPWTTAISGMESAWHAARRASIDSARAFRAAPLRLAAMAATLLLAEMVYEAYSTLTLNITLERTALGQYEEGRTLGIILGSMLFPLPLALIGVAARAALAGAYLGAQAGLVRRRPAFFALFALDLRVSLAVPASAFAGAAPGLSVTLAAAMTGSPRFVSLGELAAVFGSLAALGYVLPGVAFATRMVVLSDRPPAAALGENWAWAKGRRLRLLVLLVVSYAFELVGLAGLLLFAIGAAVTMPLARAFRDTLITQVYLDVTDSDEQSRRQQSGVRAFLRR
jgi:hypothetical protein